MAKHEWNQRRVCGRCHVSESYAHMRWMKGNPINCAPPRVRSSRSDEPGVYVVDLSEEDVAALDVPKPGQIQWTSEVVMVNSTWRHEAKLWADWWEKWKAEKGTKHGDRMYSYPEPSQEILAACRAQFEAEALAAHPMRRATARNPE